ncbi:MAG: VanZ family protein [Geminicoccales bacterium]
MSEETVIGTRRNIKKDSDFEIVGARRDAKKVQKVKAAALDTIELGSASSRQTLNEPKRIRRRRSAPSSRRGGVLILAATLLMIAVTLVAFFVIERYQPVGASLLTGPPFSAGLNDWAQKGNISFDPNAPDQVGLRNVDPDGRTILKQVIDLPPGLTLAYLEATVSTERVVAGSNLWQRARIYLAQLDETGEADWTEPHNLFRLRGTNAPQQMRQVFAIPASVKQAELGIELNNATGTMVVSDLKIYPVQDLPGFRQLSLGLMAAWAALGLTAGLLVFKSIPSPKVRLGLGCTLAVFAFGLFMPATMRDALIEGLFISTRGEGGVEPDMIGHAIVFIVMSALVRLGRPNDPVWLHLGCWTLVAIASEVLQLFTFDREPSIVDLFVDGIGFILGLSIATYLTRESSARLTS